MDGVRDAMKCASSVSKSIYRILVFNVNQIKKLFDFETIDIYIFFLFFGKSHAKEQDQVGQDTFHRLSGHSYRIQIRQIRQHSG